MIGASPVAVAVWKETRALLPIWLPGLSVILLSSMLSPGWWTRWGVLAYCLSAAILGAWSIGHELEQRTLAGLLVQPVSRTRTFEIKQGVLAAMLLTMALAIAPQLLGGTFRVPQVGWAAVVLPVLCGLWIAPWMTMLCGSATAGAVFTLAIPGILFTVGGLVGIVRDGFSVRDVDEFQFVFMLWGTVAQSLIAAIMGRRLFARLEAVEGRGPEIALPQWTRQTAAAQGLTRRRPLWLLARKEVRLQSMPFALAALYAACWLAALLAARIFPDSDDLFSVMTVFFSAGISLLVGSLASADERQLGTLEWQMLVPVPSSTQWAVKVAVVLGLTLALSVGLPGALLHLFPVASGHLNQSRRVLNMPFVSVQLFLATTALYISSLSTSGLKAMMASGPAVLGIGWFGALVAMYPARALILRFAARPQDLRVALPLVVALAAVIMAVALFFALTNHRSADRSVGRLWPQVALLTALVAFGASVIVLA